MQIKDATTVTSPDAGPDLLRPRQAAQILNVGIHTFYKLVAAGSLPTILVGKRRRVPVAALHAWIALQLRVPDATKNASSSQKLFTLKDAATALSVSPEFLKKLQREHRLHVIRLGRAVRVSEAEIDRLCRDGFRR